MRSKKTRLIRIVALTPAAVVVAGMLTAQTPTTGPMLSLTATTENVSGASDSIRIDLLRWSTDAERDQLLAAWTLSGAPANAGRGALAAGERGTDAAGQADDAAAGAQSGRGAPVDGARGTGGRGGRAGRGGAATADAAPQTPESSLAAALGKVPTLGYLWSSEVTGYSLRYAVRLAEPGGTERIILITDRRLGAWNNLWKPAGSGATDYQFSLIELRLNSKGEGEGKTSLTGKVAVDNATKAIVLENYSTLPVVLKGVKRRTG
jgi:hypothetical protein